jgi:hypothetical protein
MNYEIDACQSSVSLHFSPSILITTITMLKLLRQSEATEEQPAKQMKMQEPLLQNTSDIEVLPKQ